MRELDKELKELRLYGMAGAWEDLVKQGGHATLESSRWLLKAVGADSKLSHRAD